jgi:hypothetical protein
MTLVAAAALVGGIVIPASATNLQTTATVTIVEGITITEHEALRFGNILKPTAQTQTFTLSATGATSTGAGDGSFVGPAAARGPGRYDVKGTDGAAYDFSVVPSLCSFSGHLQLGSMTHDAGAKLDDLNVQVGGMLTVSSQTPDGSYTCVYTVTANYS